MCVSCLLLHLACMLLPHPMSHMQEGGLGFGRWVTPAGKGRGGRQGWADKQEPRTATVASQHAFLHTTMQHHEGMTA